MKVGTDGPKTGLPAAQELLEALIAQTNATTLLLRRAGFTERDIADCTSQANAAIAKAMGTANVSQQSAPVCAQDVVNEQAEDEGLWFVAQTITEDMLQRALRRLHAAIEGTPYLPVSEVAQRAAPQGALLLIAREARSD